MKIDPSLIVPNEELSLAQGAICVTGWQSGNSDNMANMYISALSKEYGFSKDTPWKELPEEARSIILFGTGDKKLHVSYKRDYGSGEFYTAFEVRIHEARNRGIYGADTVPGMRRKAFEARKPCGYCRRKINRRAERYDRR